MTNNEEIGLEIDEFNLEDLIVLGEHKKIPIEITFPKDDGSKVKAKVLIRQLTLKEMEDIPYGTNDVYSINIAVLAMAMFKANGDKFTPDEIEVLPIGVVNAISNKIQEVSGVEFTNQRLRNF